MKHRQLLLILGTIFIFSQGFPQTGLNKLLLQSVKRNNFDSVKLLIKQGADVNYTDTNKAPVVMWAALKGDLNMVKYLVQNGADVKKKGIIEDNYYIYGNITGISVARRDLSMLRYLIENCGIPYNDKELDRGRNTESGWDPLAYSLNIEDTNIIRYLIGKDTLLNPMELYSISAATSINLDNIIIPRIKSKTKEMGEIAFPLFEKSILSNKIEFIKQILSYWPVLNGLNEDSLSPLSLAIINNVGVIAQFLLEKGADVNQVCEQKKTPLFYAIDNNDLPLVKDLINKGAKLNRQDMYGRTPLFYSTLQNRKEIAQYLVSSGADVNLCATDGDCPLIIAQERGYNELSLVLLKANARLQPNSNKLKPKLVLPPGQISFEDISISQDNKFLLSSTGQTSYLWDCQTGKLLRKITASQKTVEGLFGFSNDNNSVIYCDEGKIIYWDIRREEPVKEIFYPPSGGVLICHEAERYLYKLDNNNKTYANLAGHIDEYGRINRYGSTITHVIDLDKNAQISTIKGYFGGMAQNGHSCLTMWKDSVYIWDAGNAKILKTIKSGRFFQYDNSVISNDGKYFLLNESFWDSTIGMHRSWKIILMNTENQSTWIYPLKEYGRLQLKFSPETNYIMYPKIRTAS